QIGVVRDDDHQAVVVIRNPEDHRVGLVVRFPGPPPTAAVSDVWNLHDLIDVKKRVKDLVLQVQLDGLAIGKDLVQLLFNDCPLPKPPKVIHMQKTSAVQVLPDLLRFLGGEVHPARLDNVEIG